MREGVLLRAEAAGLASVGGGQTREGPVARGYQASQTQKVKTWEGFTLPGLTSLGGGNVERDLHLAVSGETVRGGHDAGLARLREFGCGQRLVIDVADDDELAVADFCSVVHDRCSCGFRARRVAGLALAPSGSGGGPNRRNAKCLDQKTS